MQINKKKSEKLVQSSMDNILIDSTKEEINNVDVEFENFVSFIKGKSLADMQYIIKHNFEYISKYDKANYIRITDYYNQAKLWGTISLENENYELINNNAEALVDHLEDIEWLYSKLGDYRSKKILLMILNYWLKLDYKRISQIQDKNYAQYFDLDLVSCNKEEVFVDIGGFIGDTLISYSQSFGKENYKNLYCYEIVPTNIEYIKSNIERFKLDNVIVKEKGVSDKKGVLYLSDDELSSISQLQEEGKIKVETVTIDEDIKGRVSFIKMDIEGAEEKALIGCKKKIKEYHPKLSLSVYHTNHHLWKLAKIIDEIDPNYKFYLRYYGGVMLPTEYLLYAI